MLNKSPLPSLPTGLTPKASARFQQVAQRELLRRECGRAIARATHQLRDEISVYEACASLLVSVPSPKFASPAPSTVFC
jgi:hypothetical protein